MNICERYSEWVMSQKKFRNTKTFWTLPISIICVSKFEIVRKDKMC